MVLQVSIRRESKTHEDIEALFHLLEVKNNGKPVTYEDINIYLSFFDSMYTDDETEKKRRKNKKYQMKKKLYKVYQERYEQKKVEDELKDLDEFYALIDHNQLIMKI